LAGTDLGQRGGIGEQVEGFLEDASSSGLISTASGRPLRVTVIRSWVCSTRSTISESLALTSASGNTSDMTTVLVTLEQQAGVLPDSATRRRLEAPGDAAVVALVVAPPST